MKTPSVSIPVEVFHSVSCALLHSKGSADLHASKKHPLASWLAVWTSFQTVLQYINSHCAELYNV